MCKYTRLSISHLDLLLGDYGNMITDMTLPMLMSVFYMAARACQFRSLMHPDKVQSRGTSQHRWFNTIRVQLFTLLLNRWFLYIDYIFHSHSFTELYRFASQYYLPSFLFSPFFMIPTFSLPPLSSHSHPSFSPFPFPPVSSRSCL